jgi:hypothetical protein
MTKSSMTEDLINRPAETRSIKISFFLSLIFCAETSMLNKTRYSVGRLFFWELFLGDIPQEKSHQFLALAIESKKEPPDTIGLAVALLFGMDCMDNGR